MTSRTLPSAPGKRRLLTTLLWGDLRSIRRDSFLAFLVLMPLLVALIFRYLIPDQADLERMIQSDLPADIAVHRSLLLRLASGLEPGLMGIFVGISPGLIGAVYGLLLVDERDQRTLMVLRIMPVAFGHYLAARMAAPCVLAILVTIVAYPVAGMWPVHPAAVILTAIAGATTVPTIVLLIATLASNKVAALAIMRVSNGALALPFLAWFASPAQELMAWPVPSFWQMKALWLAGEGKDYLWALALTPAINLPLSYCLYRWFVRRPEA